MPIWTGFGQMILGLCLFIFFSVAWNIKLLIENSKLEKNQCYRGCLRCQGKGVSMSHAIYLEIKRELQRFNSNVYLTHVSGYDAVSGEPLDDTIRMARFFHCCLHPDPSSCERFRSPMVLQALRNILTDISPRSSIQ